MRLDEKFSFLIFISKQMKIYQLDDQAEYYQKRYCELKDKIDHFYSLDSEEQVEHDDEHREIYLEMKYIEEWATVTTLEIARKYNQNLELNRTFKTLKTFCS